MPLEIGNRAQDSSDVTVADQQITVRADDDRVLTARTRASHHRDRRQIPVQGSQRRRTRHRQRRDQERLAADRDLVDAPAQAGLDNCRRGQLCDVQHRTGAIAPGHRPTDRLIPQLRHHPHIRTQFPCHHGDLEILQLVIQDADNRPGAVDPRRDQGGRRRTEGSGRRCTPTGHDVQLGVVAVLLEDGDRLARPPQLLDDAHADATQPAQDHMPVRPFQVSGDRWLQEERWVREQLPARAVGFGIRGGSIRRS